MSLTPKYWIRLISEIGIWVAISFIPAMMAGNLFATIASKTGANDLDKTPYVIGVVAGGALASLLMIGAIEVTLELLGFQRPYNKADVNFISAQAITRKVLLIIIAIFSWLSICAVGAFAYFINTHR